MEIKKVALGELKEKIKDSTIKQADFKALRGQDGTIFEFEDNLFTKTKNGWIMAKIPKEDNLNTTNKLQTTNTDEIIKWCINLKKFIDYEVSKINKEIIEIKEKQQEFIKIQADILKTTKEYIDSKFK